MGQPCERVDIVHAASLEQRRDRCPRPAAAVAAGEDCVLSDNGLGPDRAFDGVGVDFDPAIDDEALQGLAARDRIADRFGQFRFPRDPSQLGFPQREEPGDDRGRPIPPAGGTDHRILAADFLLDLPELGRKRRPSPTFRDGA